MQDEKIRLLVCDLDGTLLNDDKQITQYTSQMLQKARAGGMKVCFASGRYESMMSIYTACVGGIDYNLSCNGAVVRDEQRGDVIHHASIHPKTVNLILNFLHEQKMAFMMYTTDTIYYLQGVPALQKRLLDYEKLSASMGFPAKLNSAALSPGSLNEAYNDVVKIVAYEERQEKLEMFELFIGSLGGIHCESTGYGLLSAADLNASKKTALRAIMQVMEISEQHVCVFGDYTNDLSMFDCAAHRVAVANAVQQVKDYATAITSSNNHDGVARYIERLLQQFET